MELKGHDAIQFLERDGCPERLLKKLRAELAAGATLRLFQPEPNPPGLQTAPARVERTQAEPSKETTT